MTSITGYLWGLPVLGVARVFDGENFAFVAAARAQVGIAGFQLQVEAFAAGPAFVVFEFDFAVETPIGVGRGTENLPRFARDGEGVADED